MKITDIIHHRGITTLQVKQFIDNYYNIDLSIKSRKDKFVIPREYFYKMCYKKNKIGLAKIGNLAKRDHATVLHGLKEFENRYSLEKEYKDNYIKLSKALLKNIGRVTESTYYVNLETIGLISVNNN